ncbi:MAG: MBL fold metallo-hydrolase [Planctomycetota bacterium]|nr:MAG: MBL fold metallo-hydrolase [Planctomycetota bacterium]
MDVRVISIGTLAEHPLRDTSRRVRTGHATTTLVRSGDAAVLIDPGLPPAAIVARLDERAGLDPSDITHVFLTSFKADTCRGLRAFDHADWYLSEVEREAVGIPLAQLLASADDADDDTRKELEYQVSLLRECKPAPDSLARGVDLFPLPGVTPGMTGLLVAEPNRTTLVCGDAIPTLEHYEQGKVLKTAHNPDQALESFQEALEIADVLVLGRDNLVVSRGRGMV